MARSNARREVAVAGEPQPPALGVAHTEPLDRWGLLLGLLTHGAHPTGVRRAADARGCRGDRAAGEDRPPGHEAHTDTRAQRVLVVVGIVVLAFNLRPAAVSVGPVLDEITSGLSMSSTTAGVLTTLPVLAFAGFGALAPWLARVLGPAPRHPARADLRGRRPRGALAALARAVLPAAVAAGAGRHGDRERAAAVAGQAALPRPGRPDDVDLHDLAGGRPDALLRADRPDLGRTSAPGAGGCSPGRSPRWSPRSPGSA